MSPDDSTPSEEPAGRAEPPFDTSDVGGENTLGPDKGATASDAEFLPLDLGPLFALSQAGTVPRLIADANRIGASVRAMTARTSAALAPLSGLDVALSSQLVGLRAGWSSSIAQATESFRLATAAVPTVASFAPAFDSPAFSTAAASPALVGLGKAYGGVLSDLERTTGALLREAALVPPALTAMQETVRAAVEQAQRASLGFRADVLPTIQAAQSWRDDLSAVLSATAPGSAIDTARLVRSFERFASAPTVLSELSRLAGAHGPDGIGDALASEFPAAVRRAAVATPAGAGDPDVESAVVAFAVAWVQAAAVRAGRALSPGDWMALVLGLVGLWMTYDAAASSTADARRIVEAVESQTEAIRQIGLPGPPGATHVVVETASLHAHPEPSSPHVGVAYPNQGVRVEAVEGGWCRVVFEDRVARQTRAGWVAKGAVSAVDGGESSQ